METHDNDTSQGGVTYNCRHEKRNVIAKPIQVGRYGDACAVIQDSGCRKESLVTGTNRLIPWVYEQHPLLCTTIQPQ